MSPILQLRALLKECSPEAFEVRVTDKGAGLWIPTDSPTPPTLKQQDANIRVMVLLKNNAHLLLELFEAAEAVLLNDLMGPHEDRLELAVNALKHSDLPGVIR